MSRPLPIALIIALGALCSWGAHAQVAQREDAATLKLQQGAAAYQEGDYLAAVAAYREVVDGGWEGVELEYNLGLSALQAGQLGLAVLSLERARRLDPRDEAVRLALARAQAAQIDELAGDQGLPFFERVGLLTPAAWATASFAAAWLLFFGVWLAGLLRGLSPSRLSLSLAGPLALVLLTGIWLGASAWARDGVERAVVMVATAPVREGPAPRYPTQFEVHEGLVVELLERQGPYLRVRLGNGLSGWAEARSIEAL